MLQQIRCPITTIKGRCCVSPNKPLPVSALLGTHQHVIVKTLAFSVWASRIYTTLLECVDEAPARPKEAHVCRYDLLCFHELEVTQFLPALIQLFSY